MPNIFLWKTMENIRNRCKIEFFKKMTMKKLLNNKVKLTFNGIHKSHMKIMIAIHLNKMKF